MAEISDFQRRLSALINDEAMEHGSDTPDYILAEYLNSCLLSFHIATNSRSVWYAQRRDVLGDPPAAKETPDAKS